MNRSHVQKPLWISHRGYKAHAVENTENAFKAAVEIGFSALETDLRITKDRHLVLIHDPALRRLAGDRRRVSDLTRKEIEGVRLAHGENFLFFDRFAELFKHCTWTLDIKPEHGEETIAALDKWAQQNNFSQQLISRARFLTWKAAHEKQLKLRFPEAVCYARRIECWRADLSAMIGLPVLGAIKPGRTYAIPPYFIKKQLFKQSVVRTFHQRNAKLIAFLPDTDRQACQAAMSGFDEILTNEKIISC